MRVLITGGTGFVGMHTALAVHRAGHEICLFVRNSDKMMRVFKPYGLQRTEHIQGDITDGRAVEQALTNCDAVVHAAAVVDVHQKNAKQTIATTKQGTELVIGGAVRKGIKRILHVSSIAALFDANLKVIDENTALGSSAHSYARSKLESDRYVRQLQGQGAPIHTSYPGSVIGPDDPGMSVAVHGLQICLDNLLPITSTGIQLIDVRDLALAHVNILERGGSASRCILGGQYFEWAEFAQLLETLLGTRLRKAYLPRWLLQAVGRSADLANRFVSIDDPMSLEATTYASKWVVTNDQRTLQKLGIQYRNIRETLTDTILWLHDAGHLRRKQLAANLLSARERERG